MLVNHLFDLHETPGEPLSSGELEHPEGIGMRLLKGPWNQGAADGKEAIGLCCPIVDADWKRRKAKVSIRENWAEAEEPERTPAE